MMHELDLYDEDRAAKNLRDRKDAITQQEAERTRRLDQCMRLHGSQKRDGDASIAGYAPDELGEVEGEE